MLALTDQQLAPIMDVCSYSRMPTMSATSPRSSQSGLIPANLHSPAEPI